MKRVNPPIHQFLIDNNILNTPELNDISFHAWGSIIQNVITHHNSYLDNVIIGNSPGPIEKHPYIDRYSTEFDLSRKYLVLGTFPPSSYFNNLGLGGLPNPNVQGNIPLDFYYGNTSSFWNFLFGFEPENVDILKNQLQNFSISISDVFKYIQRGNMNQAADINLYNIVLNCDVKGIFNSDSRISNLLFTSGSLKYFLNNNPTALTGFRWILEDCMNGLNNFEICGSFDGNGPYFPINNAGINNAVIHQNGSIVWWLKYNDKKIRIINLPNPAMAIGMIRTSFFYKWVIFKANENNIPLPVNNQNLTGYMANHINIFGVAPTITYRRSVYSKVLDDTLFEI